MCFDSSILVNVFHTVVLNRAPIMILRLKFTCNKVYIITQTILKWFKVGTRGIKLASQREANWMAIWETVFYNSIEPTKALWEEMRDGNWKKFIEYVYIYIEGN